MPLHTRPWRRRSRRARIGRADRRRLRRWRMEVRKIKEVDGMNHNDFQALWTLLDSWEQHAKELRRRWPGCPVDGLVVSVLQLRHWLTTTWAAEHSDERGDRDAQKKRT